MAKKRPFYKIFRKTLYETVSDSGNSVLRYRGADDKEHYIAAGDSADVMPGGGMVETTWAELKALRDAGKLVAGQLYRITDYQCTTTQGNTKSAGHQFDIVLLALSENKLAEEGWAMEHPTDVYDVTFGDGVTKKCYLNILNQNLAYIIDVATSLGTDVYTVNIDEYSELKTDEENKTAIASIPSEFLTQENLPYNYFQNSNLSAWKVWYRLDNDKSRFAWADDSVNLSVVAIDDSYLRYEEGDRGGKFCWMDDTLQDLAWTDSEVPTIGDTRYHWTKRGTWQVIGTVQNVETSGTGLPKGRGVIYRLIDEYNNDCPFDFKNIQFAIPMTDGKYNADSEEEVYMYTFSNPDDFSDGSDGFHDCRIISVAPDLNNIVFCGTGHDILVNGVNMFFSGDIYNVNIPVYSEGLVIDVSSQGIPVNGFNAPLGCDSINLNDMSVEVNISLLNRCIGDIPKSVGVFMTKEGQIVEI